MGWIDTLMSYEYDRLHSDAMYEPPSAVEKDQVASDSFRAGGGSELRPTVQLGTNESSVSNISRFGSRTRSPATTTLNRSSACAERASGRLEPEDIGASLNKSPRHASVNFSSLLIGVLLLGLVLWIWHVAF